MTVVSVTQTPPTLLEIYARDHVGGELWYYLATGAIGAGLSVREVWALAGNDYEIAPGDSVTVDGVTFVASDAPETGTDFISGPLDESLPGLAAAINSNASLSGLSALYNNGEVIVTALAAGTVGAFSCVSGTGITAILVSVGIDGNEGQALNAGADFGVYLEVVREIDGVLRPIRLEQPFNAANSYRFEVAPYLRNVPSVPIPERGTLSQGDSETYLVGYGYWRRPTDAAAPYYIGCGNLPARGCIKGAQPYQASPADSRQWVTPAPVVQTSAMPGTNKLRRRLTSTPEYAYWWVLPEEVGAVKWRLAIWVYDANDFEIEQLETNEVTSTIDTQGWVYADVSPDSLDYGTAANNSAAQSIQVNLEYNDGVQWLIYGTGYNLRLDPQYTPDRYTSVRWLGRSGVYETFTFDGTQVAEADNAPTAYTRQVSDAFGWQRDQNPSPLLATRGAVVLELESGWVEADTYAYLRDLVGAVRVDVLVATQEVATALGVQSYTSPQWLAVVVQGSEWRQVSTDGLYNLSITVRPAPDTTYARE